MIVHIQKVEPNAYFIITGDFNYHLKKIKPKMKDLGLFPTIPDNIATHNKGNLIDQLFTNGTISKYSIQDLKLSDHYAIINWINFKKGTTLTR